MLRNAMGPARTPSAVRRRALTALLTLTIVVVGVSAYPTPADAAVIFQVEFRQCNRLHVGYKNFPEGTKVRWSVSQHGRRLATGHFVTHAGAGYRFLRAKLRPFLLPDPKASVTFAAAINGRQFRTTAGRAPSD